MRPNDETIYQAPNMPGGFDNEETNEESVNKTEDKKTAPKSEKKSNGWAKMAIGGVTGVFMGAASMYAGKPFLDDAAFGEGHTLADFLEEHGIDAPDWLRPKVKPQSPIAEAHEPDKNGTDSEGSGMETSANETMPGSDSVTELPTGPAQAVAGFEKTSQVHEDATIPPIGGPLQVAHVDDSLSFAEAFAQARAEVGPGGVFHWHGGVFNTYTEAEWDSMSAADRSDFAQHVAPEVHHHTPQNDMAQNDTHKQDPDSQSIDDGGEIIVEPGPEPEGPEGETIQVNNGGGEEPTYDVHFLGVQNIENENGSQMNVGYAVINNEGVAFVDMDGDEMFDVLVSDQNQNGEFEREEEVDISEANMSVSDFMDNAIAQGHSEDGYFNPDPSTTSQDDLAQGTPDYVNDADVSDSFIV